MKRGVKLAGFLLAAMLLFTGCEIENVAYAATINGEQVPVAEYRYLFDMSKSQIASKISTDGNVDWETATYEGKSAKEAVHDETMKQLEQIYLSTQKAKEAGLSPDNQTNQYVNNVRSQLVQQAGGEDKYKASLKDIGTTDEAVKSVYEKAYLMNMLFDKYTKEDPAYQLSDEDMKTYFFENCVKAKHILFKTVDDNRQPLDDAAAAAADQKAKDTLSQLQGGADFDTLMNELSEDPGLETNPDGYVFGKGMMDPPFEEAAYALEPGKISDIVKGANGYHILKKIALTDADFDSYKAQQIQQNATGEDYIKNELLSKKFDQLLEEMKGSVTIERNEKEISKMKFENKTAA